MAVSSVGPSGPIIRPASLYSAWRAIGIGPVSIRALAQPSVTVPAHVRLGNNWLATVRGRAGWAADRVLFYGTAGGAFASIQTTFNGVQNTRTQDGWTAGAGVEWAFADNWTARAEYLYVDLGKYSGTCTTAACGGGLPFTANLNVNLFRVGVDFKWR